MYKRIRGIVALASASLVSLASALTSDPQMITF